MLGAIFQILWLTVGLAKHLRLVDFEHVRSHLDQAIDCRTDPDPGSARPRFISLLLELFACTPGDGWLLPVIYLRYALTVLVHTFPSGLKVFHLG